MKLREGATILEEDAARPFLEIKACVVGVRGTPACTTGKLHQCLRVGDSIDGEITILNDDRCSLRNVLAFLLFLADRFLVLFHGLFETRWIVLLDVLVA